MAAVALLGASGYTGRLVARALERRGIGFVAAGRAPDRVRAAVGDLQTVTALAVVDVADRAALDALGDQVDVLLTTVGPFTELGRGVLETAVRCGCHYVDSSGEQPFLRWALQEQAGPALAAGITAVPACGFDFVAGDLLAHLAAGAVPAARELHVAYLVAGLGLSRGTRTSVAGVVGRGELAYVDRRLVEEGLAEVRRLAWFPRPIGPRQAASFPGGEPLLVPRHVPDVVTVRSYLAIPGALADLVQLVANLARFDPARRLLRRLLALGPEGPGPAARETTRWACVAEAVGEGREVARAWAAGRDVYGFTAEAMAMVAQRLVAGEARATGMVAPAEAFDAVELLEELAVVTGLRWSLQAPVA